LKQISSVVDHVWGKHGVEVKKYLNRSVFRCEDCKLSFKSIIFFLEHIDKTHGIHIWYEKGLTRKRVFFDGILKGSSTEDLVKQHQRRRVNKMRLGTQQKKILTTLQAYPSLTILEVANKIHGKNVTVGGKEYNSICRSLHILEANGYVEKQIGQIRWHLKKEHE
jgi:hypothetical protein